VTSPHTHLRSALFISGGVEAWVTSVDRSPGCVDNPLTCAKTYTYTPLTTRITQASSGVQMAVRFGGAICVLVTLRGRPFALSRPPAPPPPLTS
jgi:hypothetical protein